MILVLDSAPLKFQVELSLKNSSDLVPAALMHIGTNKTASITLFSYDSFVVSVSKPFFSRFCLEPSCFCIALEFALKFLPTLYVFIYNVCHFTLTLDLTEKEINIY